MDTKYPCSVSDWIPSIQPKDDILRSNIMEDQLKIRKELRSKYYLIDERSGDCYFLTNIGLVRLNRGELFYDNGNYLSNEESNLLNFILGNLNKLKVINPGEDDRIEGLNLGIASGLEEGSDLTRGDLGLQVVSLFGNGKESNA